MNALRLTVASLAVLTGACVASDDPLPAPKQAGQPTPVACSEVPQLPPQLLSATDNAAACVPPQFTNGLPLEVSVSKGRVVEFRLYSQCEGKTYAVEPGVERCIRGSLDSWRYLAFERTCPGIAGGYEEVQTDQLYLLPPVRKGGVLTQAASVGHGCASG